MTRIKFSGYMFISAALIASAFIFTGIASATTENKSNEGGSAIYFSKIYVDGFNANSNGFKLLLRTYERRMGTYFQPFLVDVDFILIDDGKIVYQDTLKQVSLLSDRQGTTEITNQVHIALREGRNYTALAKIYLHDGGVPRYYLTATSSFTAKNDAAITEVYGDGIGASATIKSKSMVFTVEKKEVVVTAKPAGQSGKNVPGFTSVLTAFVIIFLCMQRGLRRGS